MHAFDISTKRLNAQRISGAYFSTPQQVVQWLGAMQAQDYPGALWSVGLRTKDPSISAVEKAISDREIIRTWPMRGTLHFIAADDARWITRLCSPRVVRAAAGRERALDLNEQVFKQAALIVESQLAGGRCRLRSQLLESFEAAGIATKNQRGYHILWNLSQRGLICFGPHEGKQPTFVLLDEWIPKSRELAGDEALGELAQRYFTSHGPASIKDFAGWSGLTIQDSRRGVEVARSTLASTLLDGNELWFRQDSDSEPTESGFLLPGFDEFILGYKDRSAVLDTHHTTRIVPGGNGMFLPTIVINGKVVGTWKKITRKAETSVVLTSFHTLLSDHEIHLLDTARRRYEAFLDHPVIITTTKTPE